MGDIYRHSRRALVWLGPTNEDTARAFSFLRKMEPWLAAEGPSRVRKNARDHDAIIALVSPDEVSSFGRLCQNPYFTRIWTQQELALAPETQVRCGAHSTAGYIIGDMARAMADYTLHDVAPGFAGRLGTAAFMPHIVRVAEAFDLRIQSLAGHRLQLFELLCETRECEASDPRDKVFGTLGLASLPEPPQIVPDYRKSVVSVYRRVAMRFLETLEHPLDLFCCIGYGDGHLQTDWPSWVPDWRQKGSAWSFDWHSLFGSIYPVAPGNQARPFFSSTVPSGIGACGIQVDRLERCTYSHFSGVMNVDIQNVLRYVAQHGLGGSLSANPPDQFPRHPAVFPRPRLEERTCRFFEQVRALGAAARPKDRAGLALTLGVASRRVYPSKTKQAWPAVLDALADGPQAFDAYITSGETALTAAAALADFGDAWKRLEVCLTRAGRIALAPPEADFDRDVVCVLRGAHVPHLLRPVEAKEGQWRLVGECYVASLMGGEAAALGAEDEYFLIV